MMDKNDGRVVSNFINQCINNKPITIYGDGEQTRSFCFVDDLIKAMKLLCFSKKKLCHLLILVTIMRQQLSQ